MASECNSKSLSKLLNNKIKEAINSNNTSAITKIITNFIINNKDLFSTSEVEAREEISDIIKSLRISLPKEIRQDINSIIDYTFDMFNLDRSGKLSPASNPELATINSISLEYETINSITEAIADIYGYADTVDYSRKIKFASEFLNSALVCPWGKEDRLLKFVNSNKALNASIIKYKNKLFSILAEFVGNELKFIYDLSTGKFDLFTYEKVLRDIYIKLKQQSNLEEILTQEQENLGKEKTPILDVVFAYLNLKYFDLNIEDICGDIISIAPGFTDVETSLYSDTAKKTPFIKYFLGKDTSTVVKNWGLNDIRDAIKESTKLSKLLVNSIEIVLVNSDNNNTAKLLDTSDIIISWIALSNAAYSLSYMKTSDQEAILQDNLDKLQNNPNEYINAILELVFKYKNLRENLVKTGNISEDQLNILYTYYTKCLKLDSNRKASGTYANIEAENLKKGILGLTGLLYTDVLSGIVQKITDSSYVITTINKTDDGFVTEVLNPLTGISLSVLNFAESRNMQYFYDLQNDDDRKKLLNSNGVKIITKNNKISGLEIKNENDTYGIYLYDKTGKVLDPLMLGGKVKIFKNGWELNIDSYKFYNQATQLNSVPDEIKPILKFINDTLKLRLDDIDSFKTLKHFIYYKNGKVSDILKTAFRIGIINAVLLEYSNYILNKPEIDPYITYEKYLETNYKTIFDDVLQTISNYNTIELRAIPKSTGWIDNWFDSENEISGLADKATLSTLSKDKLPRARLASRIQELRYKLNQIRSLLADSNAALSSLFLPLNSNLIKGIHYNGLTKINSDTIKETTGMNESELSYLAIVMNFYNSWIKNNTIQILPTVVADKKSIPLVEFYMDKNIAISLNLIDKVFAGKYPKNFTLANLTYDLARKLYFYSIGEECIKQYNNVINDWRVIFNDFTSTDDVIISKINTLTNSELIEFQLNNPNITIIDGLHYNKAKTGKIYFNSIIYYNANYLFNNEDIFNQNFRRQLIKFAQDLLNYNVNFYTYNLGDRNLYNSKAVLRQAIAKIYPDKSDRDAFINQWVQNGKLIIAKTEDAIFKSGDTIPENAVINPLIEKFYYTHNLLATQVRDATVGNPYLHPGDFKETNLHSEGLKFDLLDDVDNKYNIIKSNETEIKRILDSGNLIDIINVIKKYNLLQCPKFYKKFLLAVDTAISAKENASYKRNAMLTATADIPNVMSLNSVGNTMNVAVIDGIKSKTFNVYGEEESHLDARDGYGNSSPLLAITFNGGLADKSTGYDVHKTIGTPLNLKYGTSGFIKFAAYAVTNATMRESMQDQTLFRNMHDLKWEKQYDLCNSVLFRKSDTTLNFLTDIESALNDGTGLYYYDLINTENSFVKKYYRIQGFTSRINPITNNFIYYTQESVVGAVNYQLVAHLFDADGNHTKLRLEESLSEEDFINSVNNIAKTNNYHSINSLYELHKVFGGINSMAIKNGELVNSENSIYAVAAIMNNVCEYVDPSNTNISLDQTYFKLPLKTLYIHLALDPTAMKMMRANVNPKNLWTEKGKLTYFLMDSREYGLLLDPDHNLDEAEINEFTQVIASLDAGGNMHFLAKLAFEDLATITKLKLFEIDTALNDYIKKFTAETDDELISDKINSIVTKEFLKYFREDRSTSEVAKQIYRNIDKEFNITDNHRFSEWLLPTSDPNFYHSVINAFMNTVNKAVKRKYSGLGCVIVPGYNRFMVYDMHDGNIYMQSDLLEIIRLTGKYTLNESITDETNRINDVISRYLHDLQLLNESKIEEIGEIAPTDVIHIVDLNNNSIDIDLDDEGAYYHFKDLHWIYFSENESLKLILLTEAAAKVFSGQVNINKLNRALEYKLWEYIHSNLELRNLAQQQLTDEQVIINLLNGQASFYHCIYKPRNLAPSKLSWKENGITKNIYDLPIIKESYLNEINPNNKDYKTLIDEVLFNLSKNGIATYHDLLTGKITKVQIDEGSIVNSEAEIIMSNIYKDFFGLKDSLALNLRGISDIDYDINIELVSDDAILALTSKKERTYFAVSTSEPKNGIKLPWNFKKINKRISSVFNNLELSIKLESGEELVIGSGTELDSTKYIKKDNNLVYGIEEEKTLPNNEYVSYGGKCYKIHYFLNSFKVPKVINNVETMCTEYVLNKNEYTQLCEDRAIKFNDSLFNNLVSDTINALYNGNLCYKLELTSNVNNSNKKSVINYINSLNKKLKDNNLDHIDTILLNTMLSEALKAVLAIDDKITIKDTNYKESLTKALLEQTKNSLLSSFEMSRYFVCARIPALTLQSYMAMRCVGYYPTQLNRAVVSHWQTWLLGSDYDIDKSYIMGLEFDQKTGKFIGWSSLFDYSTFETLDASTYLPMPKGNTFKLDSNGFDITDKVLLIQNTQNPGNRIKLMALLLQEIDNLKLDDNGNILLNLNVDNAEEFIKILNKHEQFKLSNSSLEERAVRNAVSTSIRHIVQDPSNFGLSHSPITLQTLRDKADASVKGIELRSDVALNPFTMWKVQTSNLVGKDVIGIVATGIKAYMGLSYYYNEGKNTNDPDFIRHATFYLLFNRIFKDSTGKIVPVLRTRFSDINQFTDTKNFIASLNKAAEDDTLAREVFNLNSEKYLEMYGSEEAFLNNFKLNSKTYQNKVDLMLSLLLSAATDNAKELVLKRINCGTTEAGAYIHLLLLGFSINDIADFMCRPGIELIVSLNNNANIFNDYNQTSKLNGVIKNVLYGTVYIRNYFSGEIYDSESGPIFNISTAKSKLLTLCKNVLSESLFEEYFPKDSKFTAQNYLDTLILLGFIDDVISAFDPKSDNSLYSDECRAFIDDLVFLNKQIQKAKSQYSNEEDFKEDILEFLKVLNIAEETTKLGRDWFGLNKGIPNDIYKLLTRLNNMELLVYEKEFILGVHKGSNLEELAETLHTKNPTINKEKINDILLLTKNAGILNNFDILNYLNNIEVIVGKDSDGNDIKRNYRDVVIDYYDLLKDLWNIFHIMETHESHRANLEGLRDAVMLLLLSSTKTLFILAARRKIKSASNLSYLSINDIKGLERYTETLLTRKWYKDNISTFENIKIPLTRGMEIIDSNFNKIKVTEDYINIPLSFENLSTFKLWFEQELIPKLLNGEFSYTDINGTPLKISIEKNSNYFIKGIITGINNGQKIKKIDLRLKDKDKSYINRVRYSKLKLDLSKLNNYKINGTSLTDLFILYSIVTSKNHAGNDTLTGLLSLFTEDNSNSIFSNYFKYIGKQDYPKYQFNQEEQELFLRNLEFNRIDALIEIAPFYSEKDSNRAKEEIIKIRDNKGRIKYKRANVDNFELLDKNMDNDETMLKRLKTLNQYGVLHLSEVDRKNSVLLALKEDTVDGIKQTLLKLYLEGYIKLMYNCQ